MAEGRTQRRLAAILAADVVGYSRLMGADEEGTLARLMAHRRDLLDPKIAEHRGRIVKTTGDGVLAEFASVVDALRCAIEVQRGMSRRNDDVEPQQRITLRIGINVGDVVVEGDDLYGDGVNVAARLEGLAEPGGICISARVREDARGKLDLEVEDLGEQALKNIAWPVRIYRVRLGAGPASSKPAAAPADKPSIAVLPFTNMSGEADQQYFSDGITEDIITELARYRSLVVIARNSCFQFRGPAVDIAAVRRALGVRYVLEGSVRKAGGRVRVTAQLIDAATQSHLWAERYDRDIQDIFALQDELTRAIVATLEGRIRASGAEQARRKPTRDWIAYDYFLQARDCDYRYDLEGSIAAFARAVELDPDYVQALAWLATQLCLRFLLDERQETLEEAAAHAQRALSLDANDAIVHDGMGWLALRRRQFERAGYHFDRAATLNPNDVNITIDRANWLMYVGRLDEALSSVDLIPQRDPFAPSYVWEVRGQTLYFMKRYEEAIAALRNLGTEYFWTPMFLAAAFAQSGQLADARRELATFLKARPGASLGSLSPTLGYAVSAQHDHLLDGLRKAGLPA